MKALVLAIVILNSSPILWRDLTILFSSNCTIYGFDAITRDYRENTSQAAEYHENLDPRVSRGDTIWLNSKYSSEWPLQVSFDNIKYET